MNQTHYEAYRRNGLLSAAHDFRRGQLVREWSTGALWRVSVTPFDTKIFCVRLEGSPVPHAFDPGELEKVSMLGLLGEAASDGGA